MTSFLANLEDRATLLLTGEDARTFLQGQTTCDLQSLTPTHSLSGAHCTPQGRMICDFRLLQQAPDALLMVLPADVADAALASLGKYIVFSRASIEDASQHWSQFALWGPGILDRLAAPGTEPGTTWVRDGARLTVSDPTDAVEICVPVERAAGLAAELGIDAQTASAAEFRLLEIAAGIGHVRGATTEMFLPQMLNLQLTGRISFSKGCYTGQEVIARLHYRGKGKRAMLRAVVDSGAPSGERSAPGAPLVAAGRPQAVGNVVEAQHTATGSLHLLAVVALDSIAEPVYLGRDGPQLDFQSLPYPVLPDSAG